MTAHLTFGTPFHSQFDFPLHSHRSNEIWKLSILPHLRILRASDSALDRLIHLWTEVLLILCFQSLDWTLACTNLRIIIIIIIILWKIVWRNKWVIKHCCSLYINDRGVVFANNVFLCVNSPSSTQLGFLQPSVFSSIKFFRIYFSWKIKRTWPIMYLCRILPNRLGIISEVSVSYLS